METELKELDSELQTTTTTTTTNAINSSSSNNNNKKNGCDDNNRPAAIDESSAKDDRPLLRSESPVKARASQEAGSIQEMEKKFAAFVRRDVYGVMGGGDLPLREKVLVGIGLVILVPIRLVVALTILVLYYLICRLCTLCSVPYREDGDEQQEDYAHLGGWRRAVIVQSGRFLSRAMLFTLGFYWIRRTCSPEELIAEDESKGNSEESERPGAIISNHVSHLDILYHMSSSFPSFVAKRSVAKLPLVGLISKCLGCVYVQRESKSSDFKGVSGVVTERVKEAHQNKFAPMMMLFPEGTTTNGNFLLPFKTGAFLSKVPVLPVILRYPYQRFSPAWDSISGVRHVILLLCQFVNYMEVRQLPVYHPSQQEKDDPKLYANNVRRLMASEGNLILSDIGLAEKRVYHAALNGLFSQS
ncbi:lysophospholipid acyltransferase LPEAT1 isoform X2 [Malania oleifera]|uniref:lysophospholipid acyltransferase LPEAT1 isoform X2 n=1 Tax=Malania oleifera TaxID=397392 RepID=UPI0025AE0F64|nr:lysophospholipid acyltransferase LPEAT1 isoform X2 [Malania oleifera]